VENGQHKKENKGEKEKKERQTKTLTEWMQHEEIWQENCKTAGKTKSKSTHIFSNLARGKAAKLRPLHEDVAPVMLPLSP